MKSCVPTQGSSVTPSNTGGGPFFKQMVPFDGSMPIKSKFS